MKKALIVLLLLIAGLVLIYYRYAVVEVRETISFEMAAAEGEVLLKVRS